MARMPRLVVPDVAHHVTQRGNRRQQTFFFDQDYRFYLSLLEEQANRSNLMILGYCLMPNHVHLLVVPAEEVSLRQGIGGTHVQYSRVINRRQGWTGYLWQGRFFSCPLSGSHLIKALLYVERNPVRAGMVGRCWDYPWSSARSHALGTPDRLLTPWPGMPHPDHWRLLLEDQDSDQPAREIRQTTRTGRPLGPQGFIAWLEQRTGRNLVPNKGGRPKPPKVIPQVLISV